MQAKVTLAMEKGKNALEAINKEFSMERIDQLMEDTEEAVAYQQVLFSL